MVTKLIGSSNTLIAIMIKIEREEKDVVSDLKYLVKEIVVK